MRLRRQLSDAVIGEERTAVRGQPSIDRTVWPLLADRQGLYVASDQSYLDERSFGGTTALAIEVSRMLQGLRTQVGKRLATRDKIRPKVKEGR